jgi:protein gp37
MSNTFALTRLRWTTPRNGIKNSIGKLFSFSVASVFAVVKQIFVFFRSTTKMGRESKTSKDMGLIQYTERFSQENDPRKTSMCDVLTATSSTSMRRADARFTRTFKYPAPLVLVG